MPQEQPAPQPGSQPASQPASEAAAGPNSGRSNPAPAADNRQAQQDRDYYNKTQNVANDRRQVEQQRDEISRREAALNYPGETPQVPYGQQPPGYGQPNQPGQQPQQGGYPQPQQPDFSALVGQFGYEGAQSIVHAFNQLAQPVVQNLQMQSQQLQESQRTALETTLSARGQEAYGAEWKEVKAPVMDLIRQYGIPLNVAYDAVTAGKARQQGTDQAYQNMQRKEQGNVETQGAQPAPSAEPEINSFADAFNAAWNSHNV